MFLKKNHVANKKKLLNGFEIILKFGNRRMHINVKIKIDDLQVSKFENRWMHINVKMKIDD